MSKFKRSNGISYDFREFISTELEEHLANYLQVVVPHRDDLATTVSNQIAILGQATKKVKELLETGAYRTISKDGAVQVKELDPKDMLAIIKAIDIASKLYASILKLPIGELKVSEVIGARDSKAITVGGQSTIPEMKPIDTTPVLIVDQESD
jgi:hypothetical protein